MPPAGERDVTVARTLPQPLPGSEGSLRRSPGFPGPARLATLVRPRWGRVDTTRDQALPPRDELKKSASIPGTACRQAPAGLPSQGGLAAFKPRQACPARVAGCVICGRSPRPSPLRRFVAPSLPSHFRPSPRYANKPKPSIPHSLDPVLFSSGGATANAGPVRRILGVRSLIPWCRDRPVVIRWYGWLPPTSATRALPTAPGAARCPGAPGLLCPGGRD